MNRHGPGGHDRFLELAAAALDFEVTTTEAVEVEAHVATCGSCRRRVDGMRADARTMRLRAARLPSRRVDNAVYAEIARSGGHGHRYLVLALAALLLLALLSAAAVGGLLRQTDSLSVSVVPSAAPSSRPAPVASASPLVAVDGRVRDTTVVLRVAIFGDVSADARIPRLTVYRDGTVLVARGGTGAVARLSPEGLARLVTEADASGLLGESRDIGPLPGDDASFMTFAIDYAAHGTTIHRYTTNALTPEVRAEGEATIALAEHLVNLESWLSAALWLTPPSAAVPYVPDQVSFKVSAVRGLPGLKNAPTLDVAGVAWPLAGSLPTFGQVTPDSPLGDDTVSRCGLLTHEQARAVETALVAAPVRRGGAIIRADLTWIEADRWLWTSLTPMLPEDPPDCAIDGSWP